MPDDPPKLDLKDKKPGRIKRYLHKVKEWYPKAAWKSKIVFYATILFVLLTILSILFLGYLSYKAVTGEDLSIYLKATDTVTLEHGQEGNLSFDLGTRNLAFCAASCDWTLTDGTQTLAIGTETLRQDAHITRTVIVPAVMKGQQTIFYQLQVSCQNTVTTLCKSSGEQKQAAATTIIHIIDTPIEATARKIVVDTLPVLLEQAAATIAQLNGIAALNDSRMSIPAVSQATAIRESLNRLRTAVVGDNPVIAAQLLAVPSAPAIQMYRVAAATERQLITSYMNINQSLVHELLVILDQNEAAVLAQTIDKLNATIIDFASTPFTTVQQRIDTVNILLQTPIEQIAIAKANAALEQRYQEQLVICAETNTTCLQPQTITNRTVAFTTIKQVCADLKALLVNNVNTSNATNTTGNTTVNETAKIIRAATIAFIKQNCIWPVVTFAPTPQATLPEDPNLPETIQPIIPLQPQCCSLSACVSCTTTQYPIVFVHGHSFAESTTPEDNLNAFTNMAFSLQNDGWLYAGHVFPREDLTTVAYAEYTGVPKLSFTATYYYDSYQQEGEVTFISQKSENIETYAIRLKEAIDVAKHKTGSDKVIIVSHSMGGLVSRRYLQIFGEQDTAALIMIGTPNNGISGKTATLCPLFGGKNECDDMTAGSLFLNKLNNGEQPTIPVYTIAGSGCDNKPYDGVVDVTSVQLAWAQNSIVNGTCVGTAHLLHSTLLDPLIHPEVYADVKEILAAAESN